VSFAHELEFGLVLAVVIADQPSGQRHVTRLGNTPAAFLEASQSPDALARDPVNRRSQAEHLPFVYDQETYAQVGAGDLWEEQAQYGYKTGISVGLHLPDKRWFMLGCDRDKQLPRSDAKMARMLADLHLGAVHALTAAQRLGLFNLQEVSKPAVLLTPKEKLVLELTAKGKTSRGVGRILELSEHTVNFHLRNVMGKFGVGSKHEAVYLASDLGLIGRQRE